MPPEATFNFSTSKQGKGQQRIPFSRMAANRGLTDVLWRSALYFDSWPAAGNAEEMTAPCILVRKQFQFEPKFSSCGRKERHLVVVGSTFVILHLDADVKFLCSISLLSPSGKSPRLSFVLSCFSIPDVKVLDVDVLVGRRLPLAPQQQALLGRGLCGAEGKIKNEGK